MVMLINIKQLGDNCGQEAIFFKSKEKTNNKITDFLGQVADEVELGARTGNAFN